MKSPLKFLLRLNSLFLTIFILESCASTRTFPKIKFSDKEVIWDANDRTKIPEPLEREFLKAEYFGGIFLERPITRTLELRHSTPSKNINAFDEVPDSTWFTNRIGKREISISETVNGPVSPMGAPALPLTITSGKSTGNNPGFFAKDKTGRLFIIKFDPPDDPEMQTAASVIVNRFFWNLGYNVPSDTLFNFCRGDLFIDKNAKYKNALRKKVPFTQEKLDEILTKVSSSLNNVEVDYKKLKENQEKGIANYQTAIKNACFRASASEILKGIPKGGYSLEGKREDDPNDHVAHELRRELRGLKLFSAWLGHTDMKEDNTLDMYLPEKGYLKHYLIDFGEALGAHQAEHNRLEDGWEHLWDWRHQFLGTVTFGLWVRPWERQEITKWKSIGAFSAEHFDPEIWREAYPYWPFQEMDDLDAFWAAKIIMKFSKDQIEAIVKEGKLSEPGAEVWLTKALIERQKIIAKRYLSHITPFDEFKIEDNKLCFSDLSIKYGVASKDIVNYFFFIEDGNEYAEDSTVFALKQKSSKTCIITQTSSNYRVLRLIKNQDGKPLAPVDIHLHQGGKPRIAGIKRYNAKDEFNN